MSYKIGQKVFPTHVGMNRAIFMASSCFSRIPHARGDEPIFDLTKIRFFRYSPRTWG